MGLDRLIRGKEEDEECTIIRTNIEFAKEYEDKITGLRGKAVCITKWQYGCIRVGIQPKAKEDGTIPEAVFLDEEQLVAVEENKEVKQVERATGGPAPSPKHHQNPTRR